MEGCEEHLMHAKPACPKCMGLSVIPATLRRGAIAELARDLLELHENEALSLDTWVAAREVVEAYTGPITPNGV